MYVYMYVYESMRMYALSFSLSLYLFRMYGSAFSCVLHRFVLSVHALAFITIHIHPYNHMLSLSLSFPVCLTPSPPLRLSCLPL